MSLPEQAKPTPAQQPKGPASETIFRNINILIMTLFTFTLSGFLEFRQANIDRNVYVFRMSSFIWCLAGFLVRFITKYSYMWLSHGTLSWALSKKEEPEQQREYRLKSLKKLSFDFFFYSAVTVWGYYLFHREPWFPRMIGGQGECEGICKNFPGWPSNEEMSLVMQQYFMAQMGVNLFSLIQLAIFIGKSYRKYHEFLLHHCVTIILILFATLANQFAAGIIVIYVHNGSDIFSSFARAYLETKFCKPIILVLCFVTMLGSWVFMRLYVYPSCVLTQMMAQIPKPDDYWFVMRFEYIAYLAMNWVLVGMHCFWIYYMLKFAVKNAKGGKLENTHQAATPGRKSN